MASNKSRLMIAALGFCLTAGTITLPVYADSDSSHHHANEHHHDGRGHDTKNSSSTTSSSTSSDSTQISSSTSSSSSESDDSSTKTSSSAGTTIGSLLNKQGQTSKPGSRHEDTKSSHKDDQQAWQNSLPPLAGQVFAPSKETKEATSILARMHSTDKKLGSLQHLLTHLNKENGDTSSQTTATTSVSLKKGQLRKVKVQIAIVVRWIDAAIKQIQILQSATASGTTSLTSSDSGTVTSSVYDDSTVTSSVYGDDQNTVTAAVYLPPDAVTQLQTIASQLQQDATKLTGVTSQTAPKSRVSIDASVMASVLTDIQTQFSALQTLFAPYTKSGH